MLKWKSLHKILLFDVMSLLCHEMRLQDSFKLLFRRSIRIRGNDFYVNKFQQLKQGLLNTWAQLSRTRQSSRIIADHRADCSRSESGNFNNYARLAHSSSN